MKVIPKIIKWTNTAKIKNLLEILRRTFNTLSSPEYPLDSSPDSRRLARSIARKNRTATAEDNDR